jgi:type IV pilus assembly protein PilF
MNWTKYVLIASCALLVACGGGESVKEKKSSDPKAAAKMNVQLASGYIQRGQLEVAQEKLEKALEQDPEFVPAYTTMAVLMEMTNQPDKAEDYYNDALDIDTRNPDLHNNYGQFLCKQKKVEKAIKEFETAINNQFYETPYIAHANLGYCLMQGDKPDYKRAEAELRKALKISPNMPTALLSMGELSIATKQYLMARAYMQRYHAVARKSAASLWLQIQAEHALGDKKYFKELGQELLRNFPDSPEADKLMEISKK